MGGRRWIFNLTTLEIKTIKKEDPLPDGWQFGRPKGTNINLEKRNARKEKFQEYYNFFSLHKRDYEKTAERFNLRWTKHYFLQFCRIYLDDYKTRRQHVKELCEALFEEYSKNGFAGCVKNLGYEKSKKHLLSFFKTHKKIYKDLPVHKQELLAEKKMRIHRRIGKQSLT